MLSPCPPGVVRAGRGAGGERPGGGGHGGCGRGARSGALVARLPVRTGSGVRHPGALRPCRTGGWREVLLMGSWRLWPPAKAMGPLPVYLGLRLLCLSYGGGFHFCTVLYRGVLCCPHSYCCCTAAPLSFTCASLTPLMHTLCVVPLAPAVIQRGPGAGPHARAHPAAARCVALAWVAAVR